MARLEQRFLFLAEKKCWIRRYLKIICFDVCSTWFLQIKTILPHRNAAVYTKRIQTQKHLGRQVEKLKARFYHLKAESTTVSRGRQQKQESKSTNEKP